MLHPAFSNPTDIEDLVAKWQPNIKPKEKEIYIATIRNVMDCLSNDLHSNQILLQDMLRNNSKGYGGRTTKSNLQYVYSEAVKTGKLPFNKNLQHALTKKVGKSDSGIVSITVMTSPGDFSCPQDCHYCPNDPESARSYDREGPVALRASALGWDVVKQFRDRAMNLARMGHEVTKIELLVIGGTWSYHTKPYQRDFITGIYYAANTFHEMNPRDVMSLEEEIHCNETAESRIIGLTIETRPDHITKNEITLLRSYGVTRVQLGVQHLNDKILKDINRKCPTIRTYQAFQLLLENGFKIDAHFMPDLPGSSYEEDLEMFEFLFSKDNQVIQADQMKVYPTMVTRFTKIAEWYQEGTYQPYSEFNDGQQLFDLIIYIVTHVPSWVRINRIVRDIPSTVINGKFKETNMYQRIQQYMQTNNLKGTDIRSREIKLDDINHEQCQMYTDTYRSSKGTEYFISYESHNREKIIGFIRIRINDDPNAPFISELKKAVLIRELHVYGKVVKQQHKSDYQQHKGVGKLLLEQADLIAKQHQHLGFTKIAIISGVGVREYYKRQGYQLEGTYMTRLISSSSMLSCFLTPGIILRTLLYSYILLRSQ